jgi:hypothetical protein
MCEALEKRCSVFLYLHRLKFKPMSIKLILTIVFALSVEFVSAQYDLYLLIGQSNMAGRGKVEAQDSLIHPQVFALSKENTWVPAQDPIHFDKKAAGVGLGRTFGIEMAKANPNAKIGLIPCAVGGSSIDVWVPGGFHKQTKSHPWDDMEKRLLLALKSGQLKGILWHQGESDSNPNKCYTYETKLEDLLKRVRAIAEDEHIPFVAGEFGPFKLKKSKSNYPDVKPTPAEVIMNATKNVVKKDENAAFVKAKGFVHKGDNTHFNSESYREFGKRYAKAMLKLQKK